MSGKKCPRCGSPSPKLHPAVQLGGEVQICADDFHIPLTEAADDQLDRKLRWRIKMTANPTDVIQDELRSRVSKAIDEIQYYQFHSDKIDRVIAALERNQGEGND